MGPVLQICSPKKQTWTTLCFHHGLINFVPAIGENGWLALRLWTFYVLGPFNFVLICWFLNAETIPGTRNFMEKNGKRLFRCFSCVSNIWYLRAHSISLLFLVRKNIISLKEPKDHHLKSEGLKFSESQFKIDQSKMISGVVIISPPWILLA